MTFSSLIKGFTPHHGKHRGKGPVEYIIPHHWAGTRGGDTRLRNPKEKASASYILYANGNLIGQVPEEYRPWTTGAKGDRGSVTVEIQNEGLAPHWRISDNSAEVLAALMADVAFRYKWKSLELGKTVRLHRDFVATACPGPDVIKRLPTIIKEANRLLEAKRKPAAKPKPKPKPTAKPKLDVALAVYQGKFGNGLTRTRKLILAGYNPRKVQAEVNRRFYQ